MAHGIPYVATATVAELRDLEAKVQARDGVPRRALHPHLRALPARLGTRLRRHDPHRAAGQGDRALPGVSRPSTARSTAVSKIRQPAAGRGVSEAAEALRAPVLARSRARDVHRAHPGDRRPQHPALRPARCERRADRCAKPFAITLDAGLASPTTPAPGAPSARCTSTGCRPATTPARPARTSRAGSTTPNPATTRRRGAC